jgi:peptidyl-prolyl cis-trans isomerase B (cyclophilin B)
MPNRRSGRPRSRFNYQQYRKSQLKRKWFTVLWITCGVVGALCIGAITWAYIDSNSIPTASWSSSPRVETPPDPTYTEDSGALPDFTLAKNTTWTMTMQLSQGPIEVELYGDKAPKGVASMIHLAIEKWYSENKAICSRLTNQETFKILECGDPKEISGMNAGYMFGPIENAPEPFQASNGGTFGLYPAGSFALLRAQNEPYTQGNYFFMTFGDTQIPYDYAGGYSIIGKIVKGLDVIQDIAADGTVSGDDAGAPKDEVLIKSVKITDALGDNTDSMDNTKSDGTQSSSESPDPSSSSSPSTSASTSPSGSASKSPSKSASSSTSPSPSKSASTSPSGSASKSPSRSATTSPSTSKSTTTSPSGSSSKSP